MCLLIRLFFDLFYVLFYFVLLCIYKWYMRGSSILVVRFEGEDEYYCFYVEDNYVE